MKFVDQVNIHIKAGDGGNGCVAFRREKFIERGGPSGGDGGKGGDIIVETDPRLTTLLDYSYTPRHFARDGSPGEGSDCNGKSADDLLLKVPVGAWLASRLVVLGALVAAGWLEPALHLKAAVVDGVAWLDDRNWA